MFCFGGACRLCRGRYVWSFRVSHQDSWSLPQAGGTAVLSPPAEVFCLFVFLVAGRFHVCDPAGTLQPSLMAWTVKPAVFDVPVYVTMACRCAVILYEDYYAVGGKRSGSCNDRLCCSGKDSSRVPPRRCQLLFLCGAYLVHPCLVVRCTPRTTEPCGSA